tara:strand:+ start:355 stop:1965 length:1611 start_codon:yes stop_codon:yes gene_type:complete
MYFVYKINKFIHWVKTKENKILPCCEFVLSQSAVKKTVIGFLPCHHSNIGYELNINETPKANYIKNIISIKTIKKKSILPTYGNTKYPKQYEVNANYALKWLGLLVCSVIYPYTELCKMNINAMFDSLVQDIERSALRHYPHSQNHYRYDRAAECIKEALIIMMEKPYNDFEGFQARMQWQKKTRYSTATKKKPVIRNLSGLLTNSELVQLQQYRKNVYSVQAEIDIAENLATEFSTKSTTLVHGSHQHLSGNTVVLNVEDAYRIRCETGTSCQIYMMSAHKYTKAKCRNLGITGIKVLPPSLDHVNVAFAHLWGVEELTKLTTFNAMSYTLIGRLDQYPHGRGQFFRDMLESRQFSVTPVKHFGTDNIVYIPESQVSTIETRNNTIHDIAKRYKTVQCFYTGNDQNWIDQLQKRIDTGRRQLKNPRRIRSLRDKSEVVTSNKRVLLEEECYINGDALGINASVVDVWKFKGVAVNCGILICNSSTTSFDVGVAKSYCRQSLYLINGQNYFNMKKPKPRLTINPFQIVDESSAPPK